MKNGTGKILSFLFLLNLLFLQGVSIAEARHTPVTNPHDLQQHFTAAEHNCGPVSLLCETDELEDDDDKLTAKLSRINGAGNAVKFFSGIVSFSFPGSPLQPAPISRSAVFSRQGISLIQAHCSFLI